MKKSVPQRSPLGSRHAKLGHWILEETIGKPGEQGEVWRAHSTDSKRLKFAVKILRSETSQSEFKMLAAVTHPNIVRVFATGIYSRNESKHLFYVMEYLGDKVLPLNDALNQVSPDNRISICLQALMSTALALKHVHDLRRCHGDLKPSNILVSDYDSTAPLIKLIDFGFASSLASGSLAGRLARKSSSKHRPDNCATPRHADIWQLAHSLGRLMHVAEVSDLPVDNGDKPWPIDSADYSEIKNLIADWSSNDVSSAPETGDPKTFFATLRRLAARYDIRNLSPNLRGAVRYLEVPEIAIAAHIQPAFEAIRLPPRQLVLYTERIRALISLPEIGVLRFTRQLGLTHLAYPGALGTRFEHSLGVYYLACRFLTRMSAENSFRRVCKDSIDGLKFILAALLHDIGHFPFAHQIEEFSARDFSKNTNSKLRSFVADHSAHRKRGRDLLRTKLYRHLKALFQLSHSDIDEIEVLAFSKRGSIAAEQESTSFLHTLLDGEVDLDKLDYVERDAHHCGVPYGNYLDIERVLETMRIVRIDAKPALAFDWRGVGCLEQLATARHQMYANVYWHRAVRSATTMFKHAFFLYSHLVSERTLESVFFHSHADDAVLSAIGALRGVKKHQRGTREAIAVKKLIDAVSGHSRILYKEVFETEHTKGNVEDWGYTYPEQRQTAKRLFKYLRKNKYLDSHAAELEEHNVLIDCHADTSPDFHSVLIINHEGQVIRLGDESRIVMDLKENFQRQACRIRIFINQAALSVRFQDRENRGEVHQAVRAFLRQAA